MAKKKKAGRRGKRRTGRRKGRRTGRRTKRLIYGTAITNKATIPDQFIVKLPYFDTIKIPSTGVATYSNYAFNLNSVYDPDSTGSGHYPKGYEFWSVMYGLNMVTHVTFEIYFYCSDTTAITTNAPNVIVGYRVMDEGAPILYTTPMQLVESPMDRYQDYHALSRNTAGTTSSQTPIVMAGKRMNRGVGHFKRTFSIKDLVKHFGTGETVAVGGLNHIWPFSYQATSGNNPAARLQILLFAMSLPGPDLAYGGGLLPIPEIFAMTRLTYTTKFWQPYPDSNSNSSTGPTGPAETGSTGTYQMFNFDGTLSTHVKNTTGHILDGGI